jgi:hypothetical protein
MAWRLAKSIDILRSECDKRWPNRPTASDGTIGDASHASRQSDHNPWVKDRNGIGVVRAVDIDAGPGLNPDEDHDTIGDTVASACVRAAKAGHRAMGTGSYVIWEHRIASAKSDWEWRRYTGEDPHTSHPHISVATAQSGYDSTQPWGIAVPDSPENVVVREGESLKELAARLKTTTERIRIANITRFGGPLRKGEVLKRPKS